MEEERKPSTIPGNQELDSRTAECRMQNLNAEIRTETGTKNRIQDTEYRMQEQEL